MVTLSRPVLGSAPLVLRDGSTVQLRDAQPADAPALLRFLKGLSFRSLYLRFCCGGPNLAAIANDFAEVGSHGCGVVAVGAQGEIVAQAEYVPLSSEVAEVAVVVADSMQGLGLATRLIEYLVHDAHDSGIERFVAEVLPTNEAMLAVFAYGFGATVVESDSVCSVEFEVAAAAAARAAA